MRPYQGVNGEGLEGAAAAPQTSPLIDSLGRLATLLQDYRRDEIWLEVRQVYPFAVQQPQVVVAVIDPGGRALRQPPGLASSLTFRLDPAVGSVNIGDRFRVRREGERIRVSRVTTPTS